MQLKLQKGVTEIRKSDDAELLSLFKTKSAGAVYTRPEVVNVILDLLEYTADKPLHKMRLLEPSFGNGSFLLPVLERLFQAYKSQTFDLSNVVADLRFSIKAVEVNPNTFQESAQNISDFLIKNGLTISQSSALLKSWLVQGDFLLEELDTNYTHVVGNPPYIRQELIPAELIAEYRKRFKTIYDRADIYIPFIEKSLSLLGREGTLGFICSDRWMKNRYGGPLRQLINERYYFKYHIDMNNTAAFHNEVLAYPAITIIQNTQPAQTSILKYSDLIKISSKKKSSTQHTAHIKNQIVPEPRGLNGAYSNAPWIFNSDRKTKLMRRLESCYPTIESTGCKVGIGVATGADKAFIAKFDELDVEPDRKLPIVMTRDIVSGVVEWRGYGIINPFAQKGGLVSLDDYPKLAKYLELHSAQIKARHVAKRSSENWYRTIDRIYPELAKIQKLLIPDIKGEAHIVYEQGNYYPHHNLYYITSDNWDLKALRTVLLSGIAKLFVSAYSTKMKGGFLRFQAQYIRRIRLPEWKTIPDELKIVLIEALPKSKSSDGIVAVSEIYKLTMDEQKVLEEVNQVNGSNFQ